MIFIGLFTVKLAAQEAANDPFLIPADEVAKEHEKWPKKLAPPEADLKQFGEPNLAMPIANGREDVRFIWVPTFHKPISIRVTKKDGKVILKTVIMSGKGGYSWGKIESQSETTLTEKQWQDIITLVSVDGAREPSQQAKAEYIDDFVVMMSGLDGSTWYLEVRDKRGYTVEGVPNPLVGGDEAIKELKNLTSLDFGPFLAVCQKLWGLAELTGTPKY